MSQLYIIAGLFGLCLLVLVLAVYVKFLYRAFWLHDREALGLINSNLTANLGIPCSALAAFGLVASLYLASPAHNMDQIFSIKAFNIEFTGPAGPVMLWVVCFLSFIAALKMLRTP